MKRVLLGIFSAVMGAAAAVIVHCSFMIVEIDSSYMLPTFEPEQKVLVFLLADKDEIKEGDLIAYDPPFYQIDGGSGPLVRRVSKAYDGKFELTYDAELTEESGLTVDRDDILGMVIAF